MNALTDLEFRVWTQYILSADDGGVMRMSGLSIQADNDALASRPLRQIDRALQRIVDIGLLASFEHQGRRYLCDPRWQDFQHVQWPRESHNPLPPEDVLAKCSKETRSLLEKILERSRNEHRKGHRLKANGTRQEAEANGNGSDPFERFWDCYPRKVGKDAARREFDKLAPDNDLTSLMCAAIDRQRASAQWLRDGGQFIPHPRTWLHQGRWKDGPSQEQPSMNKATASVVQAIQRDETYD